MSVTATTTPSEIDRENPWPGLSSFTEDTRGFFFGRDKETDELSRLVRRETLTVLFGQSGLGKSSLLQAGLFPLLRENDHLPLYLRLDHSLEIGDRPSAIGYASGAPPLAEQVKAALNAAFVAAKADAPALGPDETLWEYFHRKDVDIWSAKNRLLTPVLAFDQFEEIFTLGRADDARRERSRAFLTELADLIENRPPAALREKFERGEVEPTRFNYDKPSCRVILSLREDYLPDLEGLKQSLPALVHNRLRLKRLNGAQALEAVSRPAPQLLAEGVGEKIVEFVAGVRGGSADRLLEMEVEPALLSVICRELNERRRALGQEKITADLVSGNRREILTDFYERSVADLPTGMRTFVEDHLLTKSGYRDNLALETALEFPGVTRPLIDTLVARRLLRLEDRLGVQRVELTHDVLAEVIRTSRDARQQRMALAQAREHEHRMQRRHRTIIGGLAAAVAVLLIGAFFGVRAQRRAEQAARDEAAQSSRTDLTLGSRLLEENRTPEGLAHLVRAARSDPTNAAIGSRLISALAYRSFAEPIGDPIPHPENIWFAAYPPGGRQLTVLGRDDVIRSWDLKSGQTLPSFNPGRSLAGDFSPDGSRWAIGYTNGTVDVWEFATGKRVLGPLANGTGVRSIRFSPDQKWLVTCSGTARTAKLWDAITGELKAVIESATCAAFSPDSTRLVTAGPGTWRVWKVPTAEPLTEPFQAVGASASWLEFAPDGKVVAFMFTSGGARLYDPMTGLAVGPQLAHPSQSSGVSFSPDASRFVTAAQDATARIWEVPSGRLLFTLRHAGMPSWPQFTADGHFVLTSGDDGVARIWNVSTGQLALEPVRVGGVIAAAVRPESSEFLTAGHDRQVRRWRMTPGAAAPLELSPNSERLTVVPDRSGEPIASVIYADRMEKIHLLTGRAIAPARLFPVKITQPLLSPDGKSIVARLDPNTVEIWHLSDAEIRRIAVPLTANVAARRFSRNSQWLANNSPEGVRIWNVATGAPVAGPFAGTLGDSYTPDPFTADGRRIAISDREDVVIYDLPSGKRVGEPLVHRLTVRAPTFSPDGRLIATGSNDRNVQLWDVATSRPVGPPMPHRGVFRGITFSRDGRRLLTWSRNEVCLWDVATSTSLRDPIRAGNNIEAAAFSDDETKIATYSITGRETRIWDSATGQMLAETIVGVASSSARRPSFHLDGRLLVIGTAGDLQAWPIFAAPTQSASPDWLLRLTTALAGGDIDRRGNFREVPFDAKVFENIRAELAALPKDAPYAEWGRWILADRATRPIGPGFTVTAAELKKQREAATLGTSGN